MIHTSDRGAQSHYILIASDTDKNRLSKPSAFDVACYRLKRQEWGLSSHTHNRLAIKKGDYVLIYCAGKRKNGMHFIASAQISSNVYKIPMPLRQETDAPDNEGITMSEYGVGLSNICLFGNPVSISPYKEKLSFIKNPGSKKWGSSLQGGSRRITGADFRLIKKAAGK